ncbi:SDR family NAD(P)-dependent oxidoreductase [Lentzea sp. NPDC051213]|uniref:SDR family NAD(P)-dependent oxidoreductase n=1 Tax=Lentzea sp. NPDC051213 TaxID=3364126 RepID=UPI00378B23E8
MATILVTGATRGLGRETARRLAAGGHDVYLGARDLDRGKEVAEEIGCDAVQLDVDDDGSVARALAAVGERAGRLDVLINNAGVSGPYKPVDEVTADEMQAVFNTNVFGVVRVMQNSLPLLELSDNPVVVNVSSGLGSIGLGLAPTSFEFTVPGLAYHSSKTALNMVTVQYAKTHPNMRINAVDPGFTATDMTHHQGTQTIEEGIEVILRLAQIGQSGPTGGFFHARGPVPW